jgi:hypothetical protein
MYVPEWSLASNSNVMSLVSSHAFNLKNLISLNKLQMDGWWLVHFSSETLLLHHAK